MFLGSTEISQSEEEVQASVQTVETTETYGHFQIEPLRRGFAHTLGNPLRRILLSSLPGTAISTARVDSALHEFSTLEFMREDLVEFLLNVKGICIRSDDKEPGVCELEIEGPSEVHARDIKLPSGVEIVNVDHHLASLTGEGTLRVEFTVETGSGYVGSEERSGQPIGVIPLDMVFSPVTKCEYHVEDARVGRDTEYDRLIVKIWTNGTQDPLESLRGAARQLVESFTVVSGVQETTEVEPATLMPAQVEVPGEPLEDLRLSNRAMNCLKRHGVETVQEVSEMSEDDLYGLRGMGVRLVDEIREALSSRGLTLVGDPPIKTEVSSAEDGE